MKLDTTRPIPLLILGDGPDLHTGLGRIGHDLAWLLSSMPEFRLGYLGRQSMGRAKYPWANYSYPESGQWGEHYLETAWEDLSQGRRGVIFTIWDAHRLLWFADPQGIGGWLEKFLRSGKFERWGYFMQDGDGVKSGCLPVESAHIMSQYQRVLLASKWAWEIARGELETVGIDWLPHGINRSTFKPLDRLPLRSAWNLKDDDTLIGCVMSNQERKSWPVVMEAVSMLDSAYLWVHTDRMFGSWNLWALAKEYGLEDRLIVEDRALTDKELALRYCACDCTVLISGGEGFCYPVAESLSCGTPVVTGSYGAQAELCPSHLLANPVAFEIRTNHNLRRAVYTGEKVAARLRWVVEEQRKARRGEVEPLDYSCYVEHLDWPLLSVQWKKWARRGLQA